jgi:hypothetical protein
MDNSPSNLAILRHMALNVMQRDGSKGQVQTSRVERHLSPPLTGHVLKCDCPCAGKAGKE